LVARGRSGDAIAQCGENPNQDQSKQGAGKIGLQSLGGFEGAATQLRQTHYRKEYQIHHAREVARNYPQVSGQYWPAVPDSPVKAHKNQTTQKSAEQPLPRVQVGENSVEPGIFKQSRDPDRHYKG
jgi:hypothetical protein